MAAAWFSTGRPRRHVCGCGRDVLNGTSQTDLPGIHAAGSPLQYRGCSGALRIELEEQFGPEYEAWLAHLSEARDKLQSPELDPEERKRMLHKLASKEAFEAFRREHKRPSSSG